MTTDMAPAELAARLGTDREPAVVDVREPEEFEQFAIPRAHNIPLGQLDRRLGEVPDDRDVVTVCATGSRSLSAAQTLARGGRRVFNLSGGMAAWAAVYDTATVDVPGARIVQVRRRAKGCLSYLVGAGDQCVAVDVSADTDVYLQLAAQQGWRITRIFDTHLHADHLSGARLLAAATGATVHLHEAEPVDEPAEPVGDGMRFVLPGGGAVTAHHTPGHTLGSIVLAVGDAALITGDTVFVESVGRPDLADRADEFAHHLYRSLHDTVLGFGDDTLVLPAHYGDAVDVAPDTPVGATLGELRANLAPLALDEAAFVAWAAGQQSPRPPAYQDIVAVNRGRDQRPTAEVRHLELGPNRCAVSG